MLLQFAFVLQRLLSSIHSSISTNEFFYEKIQSYTSFTPNHYLPEHSKPFPLKPILHEHVKLPSVSLQFAFVSQGELKHSLTSEQKFDM